MALKNVDLAQNTTTTTAAAVLLPEPGFQKMRDLNALLKRSRTAIYRDIQNGRFPAPVKLGLRASGWRNADVNEFLRSL